MKYSIAVILLLGSTRGRRRLLFASAAEDIPCLPCIDRKNVKIGVVHHGVPSTDVYWQEMDGALYQGGKDMGIQMVYNSSANEGTSGQHEIFNMMNKLIEEYCGSIGVNAILVSLPDDSIINSLKTCQEKNIPIATFNAG